MRAIAFGLILWSLAPAAYEAAGSGSADRAANVGHAYATALMAVEHYAECARPGRVAPRPTALATRVRRLAALRRVAIARDHGGTIARADKAWPAQRAAVDTSCIVGPEERTRDAVAIVRRDADRALASLARSIGSR